MPIEKTSHLALEKLKNTALNQLTNEEKEAMVRTALDKKLQHWAQKPVKGRQINPKQSEEQSASHMPPRIHTRKWSIILGFAFHSSGFK